ncbi:MAG: MFS transporter [Arenicellales bacterium]
MSLAYGSRQPCDEAQAEVPRCRVPCPQRDKPWVLATAVLGSSLAFIEGSVVNLALPSIQSGFGASSTDLQWVINAYLLALGAFMLTGGSLGDRYGLKRVFLLGTAVFGFAGLACAFAPSLPVLIVMRLVQGLGGALLVPTSLALIGAHFDEHERGRAVGTWAGTSALTTAIGPVLGGWLVDQWSWPAVFWLMPPLGALAFSIALWRVPRDELRGEGRLDYAGALLLAASLGLLIYALVEGGSQSTRVSLFILSALLGAAFLGLERRSRAPMMPLGLFRSRSFSGANLMTLLLYCGLSGALYFLPFNLIQVQGYSTVAAGAAFLPFTVIMGFGSTFAGGLLGRFDPRVILTVGPAITAAGFFALAVPGTHAAFATGFLPAIVIIGVGMTLSVTPLTTVVLGSVGERQTGTASGINNTAARIAGVLAVAGLTSVAVAAFSGELRSGLQGADVPATVAEKVLTDASDLAELKPPAGTSSTVADAVRNVVAQSYVATFRLLVILCGIFAVLSGLIAWFFIPGGGRLVVRSPAPGERTEAAT